MKVEFHGYRDWKHIKDELDYYDVYILPCIEMRRDGTFAKDLFDKNCTSITFAWLFWHLNIYFGE